MHHRGYGGPVAPTHPRRGTVVTVDGDGIKHTRDRCRLEGPDAPQAWKLNSTALKFIRDSNENPPGYPVNQGVDLFLHGSYPVMTLQRTIGTRYAFVFPLQPWSWRAMLMAMDRDGMLERIVGPGIIGFWCMPIQRSYDHKRRCAGMPGTDQVAFPVAAPVPIWDFVAEQTNGQKIRFHPSLTNTKVELTEWGLPYEQWGPRKGKGKSDGPGTYRRMLSSSYPENSSVEAGGILPAAISAVSVRGRRPKHASG